MCINETDRYIGLLVGEAVTEATNKEKKKKIGPWMMALDTENYMHVTGLGININKSNFCNLFDFNSSSRLAVLARPVAKATQADGKSLEG